MKVVQVPDPRLRVQTKAVKKATPEIGQIIKQMIATTKTFVDPEGVGLASTQVGLDGQYFVIRHKDDQFKAYFNPKIVKYAKATKVYLEGCLSIPDHWGEVVRSTWIDVEYINIQNQKVEERLKGLDAWIYQHEFDHLQGKLFVDLVLSQKGKFYQVTGHDRAGNDIFQEVKLT